jgi:four helix bundle protein
MRRAVVSIPSNISEGYKRRNRKEYLQFLGVAAGSAAELETQLILMNDLHKINTDIELSLLVEIEKMLSSIQSKLRV